MNKDEEEAIDDMFDTLKEVPVSATVKVDKYDEVIARIERYRKTKQDNIFDAFYHQHLDLMIDCINYTKEHKAKDSAVAPELEQWLLDTHHADVRQMARQLTTAIELAVRHNDNYGEVDLLDGNITVDTSTIRLALPDGRKYVIVASRDKP